LNSLRNSPFLHFTKLSHSLSGVEIPLLSIGSPDRGGEEEQTREPHVVVITGRVHPSEANGSHIVNGVIKTLLGNSESAKALRKNVVFKIIPMLNPDGVIMGNTRTSFSGKDLNRRYSKST
jgi:murein tripeptide amidase MpaA